MLDLIDKVNTKVKKMQKATSSEGYTSGNFPLYSDCYPCLSEFSTRYWQHIWHKERGMEYYKSDGLWLTKQLFLSTVLSKKEGKILLDLEYYSYIESISIRFDTVINDTLYININGINIITKYLNNNLITLDFNYILKLNDYLNIYLDNNSAIIQIKYRLIG